MLRAYEAGSAWVLRRPEGSSADDHRVIEAMRSPSGSYEVDLSSAC
jgi:hypothetical protein